MKIYQVCQYYYHEQLNTHDYGIFSSLELAAKAVEEAWELLGYPYDFEVTDNGGRRANYDNNGWLSTHIVVHELTLDADGPELARLKNKYDANARLLTSKVVY